MYNHKPSALLLAHLLKPNENGQGKELAQRVLSDGGQEFSSFCQESSSAVTFLTLTAVDFFKDSFAHC